MTVIEAHQISKCFRIPLKQPGLKGALKHLLSPHYQQIKAVDHIDLSINEGESIAYVGPNGAGKSTTIKMLTGILVPTSGEIRVKGLIPYRQRMENNHHIGVVFGQRTQLWWDLPVQESFRLLGDIYSIPAEVFQHNLRDFTDMLELGPLLSKPARQLSLGQRMRCDLAASLLHSPSIVYLDEPTIGLDIVAKERIREFIKNSNRKDGTTIMLTSHDLGDIEDICNRMIMIDQGNIVFDGSLSSVRQRFGSMMVLRLTLNTDCEQTLDLAYQSLPELGPDAFEKTAPHLLSVRFDANKIAPPVVIGRLINQLPISDLKLEETGIETIIKQLYTGRLQTQELL